MGRKDRPQSFHGGRGDWAVATSLDATVLVPGWAPLLSFFHLASQTQNRGIPTCPRLFFSIHSNLVTLLLVKSYFLLHSVGSPLNL